MKIPSTVITLAALPGWLVAAVIPVGPGETYTEIQAAIDAASPGDVIEVAAGTYPENLLLHKGPLTLRGAESGTDARGRFPGAPDPANETVIAPPAGPAIELASSAGPMEVDGFSLVGNVGPASGVVHANGVACPGLVFSNCYVEVAPGSAGPALALRAEMIDGTLSQNVFKGAAGSAQVFFLDGAFSFDGIHFDENEVTRSGAPGHFGFYVDGNRNVGASPARPPRFSGNRFEGHEVGFYAGARSLAGAGVTGNTFAGNLVGMAGGPKDCQISGNHFLNNQTAGLRLSSFGELVDASHGAQNTTLESNRFEGNGSVAVPSGHGDLVIDDQAGVTLESVQMTRNLFLSDPALHNKEASARIQAGFNYWGAVDGPGGLASGSGGSLNGHLLEYEPYYEDEALTGLNFGTSPLTGALALEAGEEITGTSLTLAGTAVLTVKEGARVETDELLLQSGAQLFIQNGAVQTGNLELAAGALLDVVDGDLSLDPMGSGLFHTISGTFTFFNSLGSLNINGDTTFSGSSLCLVTRVRVASGVTLSVIGSLILDGCELSSDGSFNLLVNAGAEFRMTRCEVVGASVFLVGSDVKLCDNHFTSGLISVFSTVNGAEIFHNVFDQGSSALNVFPGAVIVQNVEGWGNVDDESLVENQLSLAFRSPVDSSRTLTAQGELFVQPGDEVIVGFEVSDLNTTTQAVEATLGYHSGYLSYDSMTTASEWSKVLFEENDASAVVGRFNTALGASFDPAHPDGTLADGAMADIEMQARLQEGRTRFFFREKTGADGAFVDTRLTVSSGGSPSYLHAPFTRNSRTLTIDGTAPVFGPDFHVEQEQGGSPVDLLAGGVLTKEGTVEIVFDSRDELAGVDDGDVSVEFAGPAGAFSGNLAGSSSVLISGEEYFRYTFEAVVGSTTPNGIYNVDALVMDRSGNVGTLPMGAIEVARFSANVVVAPQGLIGGNLTRDVVLVATDSSGSELARWDQPVVFSGGQGSIVLNELPVGTAALSAKMNWNLRVRLALTFDLYGVANVSFSGADALPGGDFNGDNRINLFDYNVLRAAFPSVASSADVTGDGVVNLVDYNFFRSNWLTIGDDL